MPLADGSVEFYREAFSRSRFLRPERRARVNALLARCIEAFERIERDAPDQEAVARFHAELLATV